MKLRTLDDLEVASKRVLLRADFNVPLDDGRIADDMRIRATLPTIREILDRGATQIIACSHLGRPKGKPDPRFTLAPVGDRLGELLETPIPLTETPTGPVGPAKIVLLENLRYDRGEEKDDEKFASRLASLADCYVNDAFGAVHRAHASVHAVARLLPSAAGRLLEKEVLVLSRILEDPDRPFVAVIGGAKVADKLPVLRNLLAKVDRLAIGGGMCFTFLAAKGLGVGRSLLEADQLDSVRELIDSSGERLLLPTDVVVAAEPKPGVAKRQVSADSIPDDVMGLDIGKETSRAYVDTVRSSKTVFWNGPMGVFEIDDFAAGTRAVAAAVALGPAYSVVGGGDSAAALEKFGYADKVDHLSTGGGASMEFLAGDELPGLAPLRVG